MSPVIPPATDTYWASLTFGGPYLKSYPITAPSGPKGATESDLRYAERRAHHRLWSIFRRHYSKETLEGWVAKDVPEQVKDWADELAAAYFLNLQSMGGKIQRKDSYREQAQDILKEVNMFLKSGQVLVDVNNEVILGLETPELSAAGVRGPRVSTAEASRVFTERPLKCLVETDSAYPRSFITEEESMDNA